MFHKIFIVNSEPGTLAIYSQCCDVHKRHFSILSNCPSRMFWCLQLLDIQHESLQPWMLLLFTFRFIYN